MLAQLLHADRMHFISFVLQTLHPEMQIVLSKANQFIIDFCLFPNFAIRINPNFAIRTN